MPACLHAQIVDQNLKKKLYILHMIFVGWSYVCLSEWITINFSYYAWLSLNILLVMDSATCASIFFLHMFPISFIWLVACCWWCLLLHHTNHLFPAVNLNTIGLIFPHHQWFHIELFLTLEKQAQYLEKHCQRLLI